MAVASAGVLGFLPALQLAVVIHFVTGAASFAALAMRDTDRRGGLNLLGRSRRMADCPPHVPPEKLGPWKPGVNDEARANLCVNGRLVPQLYVLGEPKAGTTSLSWDLMGAGVESLGASLRRAKRERPDAYCYKEMHYFDSMLRWDRVHGPGFDQERQAWLDLWQPCQSTKRRVLADFTPSNMPIVTRPWPSLYTGARAWEKPYMDLPSLLPRFYGQSAGKLVFVILLREPLSLFQSLWYCCMGGVKNTERFQMALDSHLKSVSGDISKSEAWLWRLLFARHLEGWLENFEASQFVVVPYRQYTEGRGDAVCQSISAKLNFSIDCDSHGKPASHRFNKPGEEAHPTVEHDTTPELRERFHNLMAVENARLALDLATASSKGMVLAGYNGTQGSKAEVYQWLKSNW